MLSIKNRWSKRDRDMKNSFDLEKNIGEKFQYIKRFDQNEIDNPDKHSLLKINYNNRLSKVVGLVRKYFKPSLDIRIADLGCAQGNTALMLAEMGYKVFAVDIRNDFLEYSRLKYEKGNIRYICANVENCGFRQEYFDVIIMGELIEHCAFPEHIISNTVKFLKKKGILIITTPNGQYFRNILPAFSSLKVEERELLKAKQYAPDGTDHLFLFSKKGATSIIPSGYRAIKSGYIGTFVINRFAMFFFRFFNISLLRCVISFFEQLPLVNKYLSPGMYFVITHD